MITDYATLKTAVRDWLMRPDLEPHIPTFIRLAEAQFDRVLRTKEMMDRAQADATEQYIPLPPDWLQAKNVQRQTDGKALSFMTLEELDAYRWKLTNKEIPPPSGPEYYAYMGDTIEFAPSPSTGQPVTIEMAYYRQIPKLDSENTTNWLLRKHPDVYLYGALTHTAPFLKDDERVAVWQQFRDNAIMELNSSEATARYSGSTMTRPIRNTMG